MYSALQSFFDLKIEVAVSFLYHWKNITKLTKKELNFKKHRFIFTLHFNTIKLNYKNKPPACGKEFLEIYIKSSVSLVFSVTLTVAVSGCEFSSHNN